MNSTLDGRFLTVAEVAKKLRLDETSLVNLLRRGLVPGIELGGVWTIPERALERFLDEELARQTQARRGTSATTQGDGRSALERASEPTAGQGHQRPPRQRLVYEFQGRNLGARQFLQALEESSHPFAKRHSRAFQTALYGTRNGLSNLAKAAAAELKVPNRNAAAPVTERDNQIHDRLESQGLMAGVQYMLKGNRFRARTYIGLLTDVLRQLALDDETFLRRFSLEGGRTRKYIARERLALYPGRPDLAEEFARPLVDGWWLGTNYSRRTIIRILRKACAVAELRFGVDLRIGNEAKKVDIDKAMAFVGVAADPDPYASVRHAELFAESVDRAGP